MRHAVETGLPRFPAPLEWAVVSDGIIYTVQVPIKADGSIETGDIRNAPDGVMHVDIEQRILLVFLQDGVFDGFLWYFNDFHGSQLKGQ